MDSTTMTPKPVCAQEALALLNCAAESSYDRDKCLAALDALRACIAQKSNPFDGLGYYCIRKILHEDAFIVVIQLRNCETKAPHGKYLTLPRRDKLTSLCNQLKVKKFSLAEASSTGTSETPKGK